MNKLHTFFISIIILLSFFSGCTIEKRKYLPGYNIEWNHSKPEAGTNKIKSEKISSKEIKEVPIEQNVSDNFRYNEGTIASADNSDNALSIIKNYIDVITDSSNNNCDVILKKNGDEIKVKVIEISNDKIKYKKCNDSDELTYTMNKSEVFEIKYPNGSKDLISPESNEINNSTAVKKDSGIFGILSFVFIILSVLTAGITGGVGFFLFYLAAIVLAIIGLGKEKKEKGLAKATLIIAGIIFVLFIIAIIALENEI